MTTTRMPINPYTSSIKKPPPAGGPKTPAPSALPAAVQAKKAEAKALLTQIGGKVMSGFPKLGAQDTPASLIQKFDTAHALFQKANGRIGTGSSGYLLKLVQHPAADQSVFDHFSKNIFNHDTRFGSSLPIELTTLFHQLSDKMSPSKAKSIMAQGAADAVATTTEGFGAADTATQTAVSIGTGAKKKNGALAQGVMPQRGNAMLARMALMTGQQKVESPKAALDQLSAALSRGAVPTSLPLTALADLPIESAAGLAFQLDGGLVSGQRLVVRKVNHPEKGPGLEFLFKLRGPETIKQVAEKAMASGAQPSAMQLYTRTHDEDGIHQIGEAASTIGNNAALSLSSDAFDFVTLGTSAEQAVKGLSRLQVFGEGQDVVARMTDALQQLGLNDVFADSTPRTRNRLQKMRVLWQRDPKQAFVLGQNPDLSDAAINGALKSAGIEPTEARGIETKEVFPGHFTEVNPEQAQTYRDLGVEYLYSGVRKMEHVIAMITGDGMMSTNERYDRGMLIKGGSSAIDIKTGGADYVFTRMVVKGADSSMTAGYGSGSFQLVLDTALMGRTDWFGYPGDKYGNTKDESLFAERKYGKELVDSIGTGSKFKSSNELMFQRGIAASDIKGVFVQNESNRTKLIDALKAEGFTDFGGVPLEEAITIRKRVSEKTEG